MKSNWSKKNAERCRTGVSMLFMVACTSGSAGAPGAQHAETKGDHHDATATSREGRELGPVSEPSAANEGSPPSAEGEPDLAAAERAAFDRARPVFERHCASCHASSGRGAKTSSLSHFNMDGYPLGGHHAHEIASAIREVLGATGKRPTMPRDQPGAVKEQELELVLEWADAFDRSHAAGGHEHHVTTTDGRDHAH